MNVTASYVARLALLVTCLGVGALAQDAAPINELCPVMTEEPVDPALTVEYQGKTIGFCCDMCVRKFNANPEKYVARLAAFSDSSADVADDETGGTESRTTEVEPESAESTASGSSAQRDVDESERDAKHDDDTAIPLITWLGRFHPASVHFPIAMLCGAALAELLRIRTKKSLFADAARFCLWIGALTALAAGTLGWFFGGFHLTDNSWIMTTHRWLGTLTVAWSVVALVLGERSYRRGDPEKFGGFRVVLFAGAVFVLATGFLGGALIYGLDHYAWPG